MEIEIRSANEAIITGYVNVVERDSRVMPAKRCPGMLTDFVERVKAKAFAKSLQKGKPVLLKLNHNKVLGDTQDGSLVLCEDNVGLRATAKVTDPETIGKAKRGELRGWSFGFVSEKESREPLNDKLTCRSLEEIDLREVSLLDKTPAYIGTSIELRGEDEITFETRAYDDEIVVTDKSVTEKVIPCNVLNSRKTIEILKIRNEVHL